MEVGLVGVLVVSLSSIVGWCFSVGLRVAFSVVVDVVMALDRRDFVVVVVVNEIVELVGTAEFTTGCFTAVDAVGPEGNIDAS